jgi:crossover junction endodeoxyribonuclease RuvC
LRRRGKNNLNREGESRILGIDPGSIICGYGVIKTAFQDSRNQGLRGSSNPPQADLNTRIPGHSDSIYVASGRITLPSKSPLHMRLKTLYDTLIEIIRVYKPREMVVESIFFAKSVRAALSLGHARGIILLAAVSEGLNVYEYSSLEVKKAITGYGRAEKRQVLEMVKRILNLTPEIVNLTEDSADALAIALCHLHNIRFQEALKV